MAQTNYTPISLYYSTTASAVPTAANLVPGELAINTNDGKLYYEDSSGVVQVLATKSTGSIGGSNTQVQFNNSGSLGGSSGLTWDGSFLTTSSIKNSALTSGRVTYAGASGLLTDSANLLYSGTDLTVYGLTVGRGAGAVVTNTAVGASALQANTTASNNTAVGYRAAYTNTTGTGNVALGYSALYTNNGDYNVAIGQNCLYSNTSGTQNTAIGQGTLYANTSGNYNNGMGFQTLVTNTTGANNTALGHQSLYSNTTASNNTAVGYQAGYSNTTGTPNVFVGYQAGYSNTTGELTAIGAIALYENTTGEQNTAVGYVALTKNTTGSYNTGIGRNSLRLNTTGSYNTGLGHSSLYNNTTASGNTAVGYQAGYSNVSSNANTNIGYQSGNASTGDSNTFVGYYSGALMTTGGKNVIIGGYSGNFGGLDIRTASNYIVLSDGDGNPRAYLNGSGQPFFPSTRGSAGTYAARFTGFLELTVDTSSARYKDNIRDSIYGLADLLKIQSRQFEYKDDGRSDVGFIAEEMVEVIPEVVAIDKQGRPDAVSYDRLVSVCVKAIQELKAEFDAYKATHP